MSAAGVTLAGIAPPVDCIHCGERLGSYRADGTFAMYVHNRKIMLHPGGRVSTRCSRCGRETTVTGLSRSG